MLNWNDTPYWLALGLLPFYALGRLVRHTDISRRWPSAAVIRSLKFEILETVPKVTSDACGIETPAQRQEVFE